MAAPNSRRTFARTSGETGQTSTLGEISQTIRVGEATAKQIPVSLHAPGSTAAGDYKRTARQIAERMKINV